MNGWQALGSLVLTALLALVLVPLARRLLPRRPWAPTAALISALLLGLPFHAAMGDVLEDLFAPPPTRADAALRRMNRQAERAPALQRALAGRSQAEADELVAGFAAAGLCTLPDAALDRRMQLIHALVTGPDDVLAAGFFTGHVERAHLLAALNRLPAPDIEAWFQLTLDATLGALAATPGSVPAPHVQAHALRTLVAAAGLEGHRLLAIFQDPHPAQGDAAWAARKTYDTLMALPLERRLPVERTLTAPRAGLTTR